MIPVINAFFTQYPPFASAPFGCGGERGQRVLMPVVGMQLEAAKRKSAKATPAPAPAAAPTDTSKRFNMTQNGKKMTADDFDAWMKKNGYRVATGAPAKPKAEEPAKQGSK